MAFDWKRAKEVLKAHILSNKKELIKDLEEMRKKSSLSKVKSFEDKLDDILTLTADEINDAYAKAIEIVELEKDLSNIRRKSGEEINNYLRNQTGEGSIQIIRCKCGNAIAGSMKGVRDDGWYKNAVDYVRRGCAVSIGDPVSLSGCSCIKPGEDAIGFGEFIHKHFQAIHDEDDAIHWVEPDSAEEFSTEAMYKLYKEISDNRKIISDDNFKSLKDFKKDIKSIRYTLLSIYGLLIAISFIILPSYILFCAFVIYSTIPIGVIEYYVLMFELPKHKNQDDIIKDVLKKIKELDASQDYIHEFIDLV